jgi:6-phosphogluconolactonase
VRHLRVFLGLLLIASAAYAADFIVFAGTYTRNGSKGIYSFRFQPTNGKLTPLGVAAETPSPSFLIESANHRFLYAVNESRDNTVSAFEIDAKTGKLTFLNKVPSGGDGPCHLALDKTGKWLGVANYGSGHMALMPVGADGKLAEAVKIERNEASNATPRQKGPHAHEVVFSPDNKFLLYADLGADKIFVYKFDAAKGTLTANEPAFGKVPAGAGVRHFAFHPNGKIVYAINEIGSTITAFHYDPAKGTLDDFQTLSTLPEGFKGNSSTAEIQVNKAGTVVYGSNRGHDSIAVFNVDPQKFTLTAVAHTPTLGKTPRAFTLDPTGGWLLAANQDSSDIAIFKVHKATGQLVPSGELVKDAPLPVSIVFVPAK